MRELGWRRKRLREWLALGHRGRSHPRERAAPISVNSPPSPRGRGRDNTYKELRPVSGHKILFVAKFLSIVAVMAYAPLRFYRSPTGSPDFITTPH